MTAAAGGAYPRHNWLAAVVPVSAQRFRVADPRLASTLADAGAELVSTDPQVEIGQAEQLRGDARAAVLPLEVIVPEGGVRLVRAGRRSVGFGRVRLEAVLARRAVRRLGYTHTLVVPWEWEQAVRLPGRDEVPRSVGVAARMPLGVLILGSRGPPEPTLFDAALAEASRLGGRRLLAGRPLVRQGGLVSITDAGVVRVAVGPASRELELHRAALDDLRAASPPPIVAERVPWLVGGGRLGLAEWSLERRLPGTVPPLELAQRLLSDCAEFLVELHLAGRGQAQSPADSLSARAEVIARACSPKAAETLRWLGEDLDDRLAAVPRGFGHGDFWTRNLLTDGDRLTGVVDWHGGGGGSLPLVDLLHLRLSTVFQRRRQYLGAALVGHLLPWARAGGDEVARSYCRRIRLGIETGRLEALVKAYWVTRTARELELYADRAQRPLWMRHNVEEVVPALAA